MRIDAITNVAQIYQPGKTNKAYASKTASMGKDEVNISSMGQTFQVAKEAVKNAPDVRDDKVADLKARIENGTYDVSADDFAAKLLEKYENALA